MPKATWKNVVLAESDRTGLVEGDRYCPSESIKGEPFKESSTHTICPWKGEASYYTIVANGQENRDAAWYYPNPKEAAKNIKGYVGFWKGVEVK